MAYTTFVATPDNNTDETFRAWGSLLSAGIAAVGMVRTVDSGQIDWDTALTPDAGDTPAGYEVWAFSDALQDTHPVVWKLEYGTGGTSNSLRPIRLWITVGKGTDGAGNITDILIPRTRLGNSNPSTGGYSLSPSTSLVATCANRACLAVALFMDPAVMASATPSFVLERSRNPDGSPSGVGVSLAAQVGYTTAQVTTAGAPNIFLSAAYDSGALASGAIPVVIPESIAGVTVGSSSSLASGVIGPVLPWTAWAPGVAPWQPLASLSYMGGDATPGAVVTVRTHGQARTYKVLPLNNAINGWGVAIPGSDAPSNSVSSRRAVGLMVLWEED